MRSNSPTRLGANERAHVNINLVFNVKKMVKNIILMVFLIAPIVELVAGFNSSDNTCALTADFDMKKWLLATGFIQLINIVAVLIYTNLNMDTVSNKHTIKRIFIGTIFVLTLVILIFDIIGNYMMTSCGIFNPRWVHIVSYIALHYYTAFFMMLLAYVVFSFTRYYD
jgi:hypothetical protein